MQACSPSPSRGKHFYDWRELDSLVLEWQKAGFDIQMVLKCKSKWGTKEPYRKDIFALFGRFASTPPRDGHWRDFEEWCTGWWRGTMGMASMTCLDC